MLKRGGGGGGVTTSFGVVFTREPKVLAILKGVAKSVHALKGGCVKFYSVLKGGGGRFGHPIFLIL